MTNRPPISKIAKRFKRLHSSMKATIFIAVAGSLLAFSNCYSSTINVGVKPVEPFAFDEDGTLSGFSVELWKKISEECNLVSEFTPVSTVPDLLSGIESGSFQVGIGAISITADRERRLDFSHPFFESGLQVMVVADSKGNGGLGAFGALFSNQMLKVVSVIFIAVLLVSNILWIVERRINPDSFPSGYRHGIIESIWWAISTLISGGCENKAPVGITGRLVAVTWMLGGIALTSFITATLASAMTVSNLSGGINGLSDLRGALIGTVVGSSAEAFLKKSGHKVQTFANLNEASDALVKNNVKGVVYDSPMLHYYATNNSAMGLTVVGPVFENQDYAFVFKLGNPLRKEINAALVKLKFSGYLEQLKSKWFESNAD